LKKLKSRKVVDHHHRLRLLHHVILKLFQ
jgi:hypothetical protein